MVDPTADGSLVEGAQRLRVEPPIFEVGATIGARYRLRRLIARGGMGEVYEADDLELGTLVAVKTIRAERLGDRRAGERLKQEILAARKVTHPNVVRIFDVGFHVLDDQREVAFFTMELLAGDSLDAVIRAAGRLGLDRALELARQLAAALDASHAAGIVHRDFKSQNVIVCGDRAIVTDFGLARERVDDAAATRTVELAGTPAYMAPEQVTRSRAIGPAADIYAFGVVLFEMVTGKLPFARDTALATAAARVEGDAPSARVHVPDLPRVWEAAIARCLRREPAHRFARASDAIAALTRRFVPWRQLGLGAVLLAAGAVVATALITEPPAVRAPVAARTCNAPAPPDLHVDASAAPGGNGSKACPFRTITAALAVPGERRVIHVAAGFYDRALGEQFPLVLRGDTSLIGAGPDRTTISGLGTWDGRSAGGSIGHTTWAATIVAGDVARPVTIAELAVASGVTVPPSDAAGVLCTRGSRDAPNTWLRGVVVGPGYRNVMVVGTETRPAQTGCFADVSSSRFVGGTSGIWQLGCGAGEGAVRVGLRVHESRFESFRNDDAVYRGSGIHVWDCVGELLVERSVFAASDAAIDMVRHEGSPPGKVVIRDNEIKELSRAGIAIALAVHAEIRGNTFRDITGTGEHLGRAAALRIEVESEQPPSLLVRGNRFVENDLGVEITGVSGGASTALTSAALLDFGQPGDPGNNTFYCNAAPAVSRTPGGDVAVRIAPAPGARLALAGNLWDRDPPSRRATPLNGLDLLVPRTGLALDTSGGRHHGSATCGQRVR